MRRISIVLSALLLCQVAAEAQPSTTKPARRIYQNPLLPDVVMADPHVIKFMGKYYLYATTHTRGYDAYVSDNLVDWENKGRVFADPRGGNWAPDVFYDRTGAGKFYLYYTSNTETRQGPTDKQIGVAVADGPLGPFEDKAVLAKTAIDAHMFQDDNKKYYLYYVDLVGGFKILAQEMADPLTKKGAARKVIEPTEPWETKTGSVTEGPFMLKHEGTYYLMYSGCGADTPNYAIGYATAKSPMGPFVKFSGNPIAARGEKVLGPGHHSVVEGPDGKLWMVYHQKWDAERNFRRFLALDPIAFDPDGVLRTTVTRETFEPAPVVPKVQRPPKAR
jgi:beta-xylosidase